MDGHVVLERVARLELPLANGTVVAEERSYSMDSVHVLLQIRRVQLLAALGARNGVRGVRSLFMRGHVDKVQAADVALRHRANLCVRLSMGRQLVGALKTLAADVANVPGNVAMRKVNVVL